MTGNTAQPESPAATDRAARLRSMRVSSYDRVAGLLVALLILVGAIVLLLFIQWLTMRVLSWRETMPVEFEAFGDGTEGTLGSDEDFIEPGLDELDEMLEPALEDTLAAVTDVPSTEAAGLDAMEGTALRAGHGTGERRRPGTGGGGAGNTIPPWERWEVHFGTSGLEEYARRLDFFGIELAALGGGNPTVYYASKLAQATPKRRTTKGGTAEKRLSMTWLDPKQQEADRRLLAKAGIDTEGRYVTQFYPDLLYKSLLRLEKAHAGGRATSEIQRTVFRVRAEGAGYRFYVGQQEYRNKPK